MRVERLLTIVTPTIPGREKLLEECVASVSAQSLPCHHLIAEDTHLRGPGPTRNHALAHVTTPLVGFVDDDDLVDPEWASTLVATMLHYGSDLAWSRWRYDGYDFGHQQPAQGEVATYDEIKRGNRIPMTWIAKTGLVMDAGAFPDWARDEDHGLLIKMLEQGALFTATGEELWTYRPLPDGRTLAGMKR